VIRSAVELGVTFPIPDTRPKCMVPFIKRRTRGGSPRSPWREPSGDCDEVRLQVRFRDPAKQAGLDSRARSISSRLADALALSGLQDQCHRSVSISIVVDPAVPIGGRSGSGGREPDSKRARFKHLRAF